MTKQPKPGERYYIEVEVASPEVSSHGNLTVLPSGYPQGYGFYIKPESLIPIPEAVDTFQETVSNEDDPVFNGYRPSTVGELRSFLECIDDKCKLHALCRGTFKYGVDEDGYGVIYFI